MPLHHFIFLVKTFVFYKITSVGKKGLKNKSPLLLCGNQANVLIVRKLVIEVFETSRTINVYVVNNLNHK